MKRETTRGTATPTYTPTVLTNKVIDLHRKTDDLLAETLAVLGEINTGKENGDPDEASEGEILELFDGLFGFLDRTLGAEIRKNLGDYQVNPTRETGVSSDDDLKI